jgi:hypothetical protein
MMPSVVHIQNGIVDLIGQTHVLGGLDGGRKVGIGNYAVEYVGDVESFGEEEFGWRRRGWWCD